ncbi:MULTISPECIES: iron-sulfur cluster carrier protein ApbC [unclassified Wenzhouxiangella]|uniref:iron-sulfur cluster carrier protein ApbC n=1 Tax=unclassified Wenzhouxiangella TaxID=2613841 RepID=UPI002163E1DD|nr:MULTISPECIES: iron-sulfur cluster carrier protein ApbC [unclassified Wenzhouxiangella]
MSDMNNEEGKSLVAAIEDPNTGRPLGDAVRGVAVRDRRAAVDIRLAYPAAGWRDELAGIITERLCAEGEVDEATVEIDWQIPQHAVQGGLDPVEGVRNVIAVASGKGGVGKSTVSANLALALAAEGARVGVLDADIYGPSQPRMLGLKGGPETTENRRILPMQAHGLQVMSIGVLVDADQAMIWRGPMATQALQQMVSETLWEGLDYLVVDLPPGTGDIQLTLAQRIPVAGAVTVTTPQEVAVDDVRRAVSMFNKVKVPVLGVIENMSTHICSNCGHEDAVFGSGGGERIAREIGVPNLGQLPLVSEVGRTTDEGTPIVAAAPEHPAALRFREIARRVAGRLSTHSREAKVRMPKIKITD